jgi:hypothetical protein
MKIFLKIKAWQLFLLVFSPSVIMISIPLLMLVDLLNFIPFLAVFINCVLLSWGWSVGLNLNRIVPDKVQISLLLFKWIILAKIIMLISSIVEVILVLSSSYTPFDYFILEFTDLCGDFYIIYFIAKNLVSAEKQSSVTFREYFGDCVGLFFWAVCIWGIQKRINHLFVYNNKNEEITIQENPTGDLLQSQI